MLDREDLAIQADDSGWPETGLPEELTYTWKVDGEVIAGTNQSNLFVTESDIYHKILYQYDQEMLVTGFLSMLYSEREELTIRAFVEAQYEDFSNLNLNLGGRAIINKTFLAGASIDNDLNLGVQIGILLAPQGSQSTSTLAFNFNLPMGDIVSYTNPGIGLSFQHQIEGSSGW